MSSEVAYNQPDFAYRREEGVNQSSLKKILESPAHYKAALEFKMLPTPAMEIGTAAHCLILDGQEAFDAQYCKKPDDIKLTTKEGKEWKASIGRKKILGTGGKDDPWNAVQGMAESLRKIEWYAGTDEEYIKRNEVSIYFDWLGVRCKARLDSILIDEGIVLDLKTTDTVNPDLFTKKVVGLGYDFQAAYYAKAAEEAYGKPFRFIFAAVERRAPYSVDLFEASDEMMEEGTRKCEAALRRLKRCQQSEEWENRPPTINMLHYPGWYNPFVEDTEPEEDLF